MQVHKVKNGRRASRRLCSCRPVRRAKVGPARVAPPLSLTRIGIKVVHRHRLHGADVGGGVRVHERKPAAARQKQRVHVGVREGRINRSNGWREMGWVGVLRGLVPHVHRVACPSLPPICCPTAKGLLCQPPQPGSKTPTGRAAFASRLLLHTPSIGQRAAPCPPFLAHLLPTHPASHNLPPQPVLHFAPT